MRLSRPLNGVQGWIFQNGWGTVVFGFQTGSRTPNKETLMSMNEKVIVGETFDDLSDQEMAMLTEHI